MNREALKAQLMIDEGYRGAMYFDSLGYATIGYGRLIDPKKGGGISKDEAAYLLGNDIDRTYNTLVDILPWVKTLDDARQNVLTNMAFQLGVGGLLKFKKTLLLIKDRKYEQASIEMLDSTWAKQTPERAKRLAKIMKTGEL